MNSPVQFEEDSTFKSRSILGEPVRPKMIDFLVKSGLVNDYKKAGNVLLFITLLFFIASFLVLYFGLKPSNVKIPNGDVGVGFPIK